jgi:rubredoxin
MTTSNSVQPAEIKCPKCGAGAESQAQDANSYCSSAGRGKKGGCGRAALEPGHTHFQCTACSQQWVYSPAVFNNADKNSEHQPVTLAELTDPNKWQ